MKKLTVKGLHRKLWKLTRELVLKRSNRLCELCGDTARDIDHAFSRSNKSLFYEPSNLTALCSSCHFKKSYHLEATDLKVYDLVSAREGKKKFAYLFKTAQKRKPFPDFNKIWYLEEKMKELC